MNSAYNFNLYIKSNCSLKPHFQVSLCGIYIQVLTVTAKFSCNSDVEVLFQLHVPFFETRNCTLVCLYTCLCRWIQISKEKDYPFGIFKLFFKQWWSTIAPISTKKSNHLTTNHWTQKEHDICRLIFISFHCYWKCVIFVWF